jgi:hypothetical protein
MRKLFLLTATVGIAFGTFADPVSAAIITTDAGLAGKTFCWRDDEEKFGADHSYVFYWHPGGGSFDKQYEDKGTWAISKDGTVTLKLSGGTRSGGMTSTVVRSKSLRARFSTIPAMPVMGLAKSAEAFDPT